MLTPTQLREAHQLLMDDAKSIIDNHDSISARNFARGAIAVASYQQERIAELEQKLAAAENFAGCAKIELERAQEQLTAAVKDAARYRLLRQGRHWSIIDGIGDELRGEKLDAATDAAMHPNP